ncbi:neuroguidin isoform X2 [Condylostylus longicornis]|uniref:neuroguidin isoform X2 n=1 Tax=Condylostylus longicornis TaxID=2530218 RepID=UPI00244DE38A|nr:neuroguidin isoform X2 [Condylostylus longicornis]
MVQALDFWDVDQNLPQAVQLLKEMNQHVKQVSTLVEDMLQKVKNGELSTEYGLSFLEVKYHMLLDYLINLTYIVLQKCSGEKIENDPAIDRLIEIRIVLEKIIRPIDHKLRYQIDKLVKTAVTGATSSSDPITFKPNPNNLISNTEVSESSDDDSQSESDENDEDNENGETAKKSGGKKSKTKSSGKYVPPKLTAVHYDEETEAERTKKLMEKSRKRALTSSMLEDLKEEYLDIPTEVSSGSRAQQILLKAHKEKQEYEETYLTRLPVTKAEKHMQRKLTTLGTLGDDILGDIKALGASSSSKNKRKKTSGKKRGGKKRKFH